MLIGPGTVWSDLSWGKFDGVEKCHCLPLSHCAPCMYVWYVCMYVCMTVWSDLSWGGGEI